MSCIIKAHLNKADGTLEMRRIPVTVNDRDNSNGIFNEIAVKVGSAFPGLANKRFTLKWKDSDGDLVVMSTDEEMLEAMSSAQTSPLKMFITVNGMEETSSQECLEMESDAAEEPAREEGSTPKNKRDNACEEDWPFLGFMGPRFRGPLPPGFGFDVRSASSSGAAPEHFNRMGGSRKRCHPAYYESHGQSGHPFEHHGPFHRHFGHFKHPDHHGPFGDPMGMFGQFRGRGFFGGLPSHPFSGADIHFGHHFGRRHHGKKNHGKHGWKANLREAVPVAHRRWTKAFIRTWRVQNLKNATSTSSDSDQDEFILDASNIPAAYAKWLETMLPSWHKRLGQETTDANKSSDSASDDKNQLKASVPVEFRKWAKWYLARHFGKKESPKFRKHGGCHNAKGGKCSKRGKEWKRGCKMQTLSTSIPMMHRMWVKIFIKDWRQEHSVPDPKQTTNGNVSSESEDAVNESPKGDITIPNDYVRWMRKFLARWHYWRGDVEKVEIEKGGMAEFKDTVPKNFRKWVKCYLWQRYGNGVDKEVDTANQYQKWLQVFQKKWLQKAQKGENVDDLALSSSDDESVNRPINVDETENTAESLKKLRLEGDEDGSQKNVRFHPNKDDMESENQPKAVNIGDFEETLFHKKMSPGFRNWAKEALWQWDGQSAPTAGQAEAPNASEKIPPHIYNWMSKLMMKVQMKRMKQELKQAKHSMKATKKANK